LHTEAIVAAIREAGHELELVRFPDHRAASGFDAYFVRVVPGSSIDPPLYWQAATALELLGIPGLNSLRSQDVASNKALTALAFERAALRQPQIWLLDAGERPEQFEQPMIVKPLYGARAAGVALVDTLEQALAHAKEYGRPCLLQRFVPAGRCIRVVATQERAIRVYEKRVGPDNPIASVANGADRVLLDPDPELERLACAMVAAVGGGLMGVDVLEAAGELWPLEVNASFAFDPEDTEIAQAFVGELERTAAFCH
jgi:[lysine-biosynthesis-protein LysW]--L-2-aminoadipate ligase